MVQISFHFIVNFAKKVTLKRLKVNYIHILEFNSCHPITKYLFAKVNQRLLVIASHELFIIRLAIDYLLTKAQFTIFTQSMHLLMC
jgi:hypothetical protein